MILSVLLGLLLIGFGVYRLTTSEITCGGHALLPGQVCREHERDTQTFTYEEQRESQTRMGFAALGVGIIMLGYAGWAFRSYRRRAQEHPPEPPGP